MSDFYGSSVSSSSYSLLRPFKNQAVFLSFRGEDVPIGFLSNLHEALIRNRVPTYVDYHLKKGYEIWPEIVKAIENSHVSIVVFSEKYASSEWCLDDLTKIMECKKDWGQVVVPVFYDIDPSHVRNQTGTYEKAFAKHERDLKGNQEKVQRWRAFLTEAASMAGWDSRSCRTESEFIDNIVKDVLQKLSPRYSIELERMVGILEKYTQKEVLLDKSLIPISDDNKIQMHCSVQQTGWGEKFPKDPGRQSRWWHPKKIDDVLRYNRGTEAFEGISLALSEIEEPKLKTDRRLAQLANDLLPDKLRLLQWHGHCPKSLPLTFRVEILVQLFMRNSHFIKLWDGVQHIVNLREIDLSFSKQLIKLPDLSKATNLKQVTLSWCESLRRLHPSMSSLNKLEVLDLRGCTRLQINIHLKSLQRPLFVKCNTTELNRGVARILDTLNAASQVSHIKKSALIDSHSHAHNSESKGSTSSLLVQMGMNSQVTSILKERILQILPTDVPVLPGDNYPDWLTFNCNGASLIFEIPHVNGRILKTMTLWIEYNVHPDIITTLEGLPNVLIINHTKGTIHVYNQDTVTSEDERWHSQISTLEPDDKVGVITVFESGFSVKKTTVYLIYFEPTDETTEYWHASDKVVIASGSDEKPRMRISDVYLSFRDEDTDASFIKQLCASLQDAGIYVAKDLEALPRGDKISTSQLQEIEKCSVSVIVFSKKYANSMWCLEELEKIMKCRRTVGQLVVPVFYGVDPSEVRHQTGTFGETFEQFLKGVAVQKDKEMTWRKAFMEAGGISGFAVNDSRYCTTDGVLHRGKSENIKNVVRHVTHLLDRTTLLPQVQGVIKRLKKRQSKNVQLLGIWGMGGIGKTTFAKAIYNQIGCDWNFDSSSFLPNIREVWQTDTMHVSLQERLLSDIYPTLTIRAIHSIESGKSVLKKYLSLKKVLVLLDHVNKLEQLEALCGGREWFGRGSIIIIATRDKGLFNKLKVDHVHEMKEMSETESIDLFSRHAFNQASPTRGFTEISRNVVGYSGGLPLALVVLGSDLSGKEIREWENVLNGLKRIPHPQIHEVLKISYDDLDDREKKIFLDIAYFFVGMNRKDVIHQLKVFESFTEIGISVLDEQSLITIDENSMVGMHVLLQHMAKEIIREQTRTEFEKRIYDVFLSFRGLDTRAKFTSHLCTYLKNAGINVFMDDEEIEKGEQVPNALFEAIEKSEISVVVLSTNYANSRWCLKELEKIMECYRTKGQVVKPVFYELEPSDVRYQAGMFGIAFRDLMKKISMEKDKEQSWTRALRVISDISGFVVKNARNESDVMKKIVEDVTHSLDRTFMEVAQHPVGVESRAGEVIELLNQKLSQDPLILGIWGMGGIGKTTIAKAIFNQIGRDHEFEGRSFIRNIRGKWDQRNGDVSLQEKLLLDICQTTEKVGDVDLGKNILKKRLSRTKVLLVLDDVSHKDQLHVLCGSREWFGKGSRIIITTRDSRTLTGLKVDFIYEMTRLDETESLELFSRHAFNQATPLEEYAKLSNDVIKYCQGLPLALQVLGSYLCDMDIEEWESELETLKSIPNDDVQKKLRVSFDGLKRVEEKAIFLHIAFFFIGMDRNDVIQILDDCKLHPKNGISVLVQRCLVTVDNNKLGMHDLLRNMGREIVREESFQTPGMRSRLWNPEEVIKVLSQNVGTKYVEGLSLKFPSIGSAFCTTAFANMEQLKLLQLAYVQLNGDFGHLSKELRWLFWHGFPLRHISAGFCLRSLVAIELQHSKLKLLWKQPQEMNKLKILNLSHSHSLRRTPDFSFLPNLEKLILEDCPNLSSICDKIGLLNRLLLINLKGCTSLRILPRSIYMLKSLKTFIISGCSKIDNLEEDLERMESLTILTADETSISRVPFAVVKSKSIEYISLCGFEGSLRDVFLLSFGLGCHQQIVSHP